MSKILVYGAGPLGSVLAARLFQGGNEVSILARGERLTQIRESGIVLYDELNNLRTTTPVPVVESLQPEDEYDLILVVMRKNHALQILPVLSAGKSTPSILFLCNNAAGPSAWVDALGAERVLIGFPGFAGYREDNTIHYIADYKGQNVTILFGEVDGRIGERSRWVQTVLSGAPGLDARIHSNMDAWLRTHVGILFPTLSPALRACHLDRFRLIRTRDLMLLLIRSMRESLRVLKALRIPILPAKFRPLLWLPEPILLPIFRRLLANDLMDIALIKHANAAQSEILHLKKEYRILMEKSGVPTPAIDHLEQLVSGELPEIPDGSRAIPIRWVG